MDHSPSSLDFGADDHEFRNVEELGQHAQLSRAFIQLCIDLGCPVFGGRLTHAMLLDWLAEHYEPVRELAGLSLLAPVDGVSAPALGELRLANTMLTILEYAESRASNPDEKEQLQQMRRLVERTV